MFKAIFLSGMMYLYLTYMQNFYSAVMTKFNATKIIYQQATDNPRQLMSRY